MKIKNDDESCIYPVEILKAMRLAGYRFRLDGKAWKPNEILKEAAYGQLML